MAQKKRSLSASLLIRFLVVGIIPLSVIGVLALQRASESLEKQAFNQLTMAREIKKGQISSFFAEREADLGVLVKTVGTLRQEAFHKLEAVRNIKKKQIETYFKERLDLMDDVQVNIRFTKGVTEFEKAFANGGVGSSIYEIIYKQRIGGLKKFNDVHGFYDVFLMDLQGNVVFTVAKESDLGENLLSGSLNKSGLAEAFRRGKQATSFIDFAWYDPSNEPASFISTPLHGSDGQLIGVAAVQVALGEINSIMQERSGMGETGETYLVGSDKLMRSDSYLDPVGHTVKASFDGNVKNNGCDTEASRDALSGSTSSDVIMDYNNNPVLSAWTTVEIDNTRWALLAEVDVAEAFCPKSEDGEYYYSNYVDMYGYYDLFLLNPDGYCFYTVAKEADYQTNLVNGKYASSNLGKVVREVLQSGEFGISDFEPYAPSNGDPAMFIAQPVVHNGESEIVVALQVSSGAINKIMQQREGMGETGESYLVGSDKLMRSDSYLDPQGHSLKASFAGNVKDNGVNTDAARQALAGDEDTRIIIDYNGHSVLSAYSPLPIGDFTWAIISEIDEAEALGPVKAMQNLMLIVAAIAVGGVIFMGIMTARWISNTVVRPVENAIEKLSSGSEQVASASGQIASTSQNLASGSSEQASSLEEISSSLEEMASMTRQNADNTSQANSLSADVSVSADKGSSAMQQMTVAMAEIKKSSDETAKIIKVIDEIAFQTNLLALNAAVEAARAGEAGKGFAVVAEEVRNLAMRSAEAAKDTNTLIEGSQKNAENGVKTTEELMAIFKDVTKGIKKVTDLMGEVSAASQEQSKGIDQINSGVSQMDEITQRNASNAEESASASEELSAQAEEVKKIVLDLASVIGTSKDNGSAASNAVGFHGSDDDSHQARMTNVKSRLNNLKAKVTAKKQQPASVGAGSKAIDVEKIIPLKEDEMETF